MLGEETSAVSVTTYIYHCKDRRFFPIRDCPLEKIRRLPGSFDYLEGRISIVYNGLELFHDLEEIIFLWRNLICGVEVFLEKECAVIEFSDHPGEIRLAASYGDRMLFSVNDGRKRSLPKKAFCTALLAAGADFFAWLRDCSEVERCETLLAHIQKTL